MVREQTCIFRCIFSRKILSINREDLIWWKNRFILYVSDKAALNYQILCENRLSFWLNHLIKISKENNRPVSIQNLTKWVKFRSPSKIILSLFGRKAKQLTWRAFTSGEFEGGQLEGTKLTFKIILRIIELPYNENFTKNHALLFLHSCYFNMDKAKKAIKKYCELRSANLNVFGNRDPMLPEIQQGFDLLWVFESHWVKLW